MTINQTFADGSYECVWFIEDKLQKGVFHEDALENYSHKLPPIPNE